MSAGSKPMATEKVPMTLAGYDRLADEMKRLKSIERPAIIKAIAEARGHGDLSENAEYHAARERQSFIEGRLAEIEDKLSRAEIIDVSKLSGDTVRFGATVTLVDEDTDQESTYQIVGVDEADLEKGLISVSSPLARALIGKGQGENVEVAAPAGPKAYEILKVRFK
jgi:transcription elongation factor GreA